MLERVTVEGLLAYSLQLAIIAGLLVISIQAMRWRDPSVRRRWAERGLLWSVLGPIAAALLLTKAGFDVEFEPGLAFAAAAQSLAGSAGEPTRIGVVGVLAVIAAGLALFRLLGIVRLELYRREAREIESNLVLGSETNDWEARIGVRARYYVSDTADSPWVYGLRRHHVVLPTKFFDLPEAQRRAIVVHELLHAENHDWARLLAHQLGRCVLWFHPVVHWMSSWTLRLREQEIDRRVIQLTGDRQAYVEALLAIARSPAPGDVAAAPLFLERGGVKERVQAILEEVHSVSKSQMRAVSAFLVAMSGLALGLAAVSFPLSAQEAKRQVYRVGNGTSAPRLIEKVEPKYSDEASESGLQGVVVLTLEVHPDGRAHNIQVRRGLGQGLDEAAIEAVKQWRFKPGMKDGEPVIIAASAEINFRKTGTANRGVQ